MKPPYLWTPRSHEEYHADTVADIPTLSASIAATLVTRSPLHAWTQHPRLGGRGKVATRAMDFGTAVHSMLLGAGREVVMVDFENYRTKAAQEAHDAIVADGAIPLLGREMKQAEELVEQVRLQFESLGIILDGVSEIAAVWEEESEWGPVLCRGMFDHLIMERAWWWDLKTTSDASLPKVTRRMNDGCYDIQWAAYCSAVRALAPDLAGREQGGFLFVEREFPYAVTPVRPTGTLRHLGESRWRRAVETWARCLVTDEWPGYVEPRRDGEPTVESVEALPWALREEEERYETHEEAVA